MYSFEDISFSEESLTGRPAAHTQVCPLRTSLRDSRSARKKKETEHPQIQTMGYAMDIMHSMVLPTHLFSESKVFPFELGCESTIN